MTDKEKAIKKFAKAMNTANTSYMSQFHYQKIFTPNMQQAWGEYIDACCYEEKQNARSE